ncbi:hypothetical protein MUK42_13893 [Musa troglodytarum]|uniref:Uncharacterized protein n=1 Tax=Musa troglodytarum TaxID=320322 RepID=A0A9E7L2M9_9LILI|nr:hypothetical protein MUK42_13893 [Musa troglodytarum]
MRKKMDTDTDKLASQEEHGSYELKNFLRVSYSCVKYINKRFEFCATRNIIQKWHDLLPGSCFPCCSSQQQLQNTDQTT